MMSIYSVPKYVQHRIIDLLAITDKDYQIERQVRKYDEVSYIETIEVSIKYKDGSMKSVLFEPDTVIRTDWFDVLYHFGKILNQEGSN